MKTNTEKILNTEISLHGFVLNFCSYPSRVEYNNVVSALLLDYPFLKDYDGSAVSHAHVFLLFVMIRIVCFFLLSPCLYMWH